MKPFDAIAYLWGDEEAILRIAASPHAIWVGALLVLTAGIARTYARKDLRREPWHLLIPLAASWVTCTVLFAMLVAVARWLSVSTGPLSTVYRSLLSLYWMTAPLAWAYAVPYERWLPEDEAIASRLRTLAVVAVWRVALMVRVLVVMFQSPVRPAIIIVLLFGAAVTIVAMIIVIWATSRTTRKRPTLLLDGMAAIHIGPPRLTLQPEEDQVALASGCVFALAGFSLPVLFITLCIHLPKYGQWDWSRWSAPAMQVAPATWWLVSGAAVVWLAVLPRAQHKLRRAERMTAAARSETQTIEQFLNELNQWKRSNFPAHWRPPPAGDFASRPKVLDVMQTLRRRNFAPWIHTEYTQQFREYLELAAWYWPFDNALRTIAELLEARDDGPELAGIAAKAIDQFENSLELAEEGERASREQGLDVVDLELPDDVIEIPLPQPSAERHELLRRIRQLGNTDEEAEDGEETQPD